MAKENINLKMEIFMRGNLKKDIVKEKGLLFMRMGIDLKVSFKII